MMFKNFSVLPYGGGLFDQPVRFTTYVLLALSAESEIQKKWIKKKGR